MKKHIAAFFAGVGLSALAGLGVQAVRNRQGIAQRGRELVGRGRDIARRGQQFVRSVRGEGHIDLNHCSTEQLVAMGVDQATAVRIVEFRPYRSKLELVSRVMLPTDVYAIIKDHVAVSGSHEAVKVAS